MLDQSKIDMYIMTNQKYFPECLLINLHSTPPFVPIIKLFVTKSFIIGDRKSTRLNSSH